MTATLRVGLGILAALGACSGYAANEAMGVPCFVEWDFPQTYEPTIDGFRVYVDGAARAEVKPHERSAPCGVLMAGPHAFWVSAYRVATEWYKEEAQFIVPTAPIQPNPTCGPETWPDRTCGLSDPPQGTVYENGAVPPP
jgi:hypothetical protein